MGKIAASKQFAGRTLDRVIDGGQLWRCAGCHLAFRWPCLDSQALLELYAQGSDSAWVEPPATRNDWQRATAWIKAQVPDTGSVLDVGCFDGAFLASLAGSYERLGVEPGRQARALAQGKGIRIIGEDFEQVRSISGGVDCITALDVIEHVRQPQRFLAHCRGLLKPGGCIVLSTGNLDSPTFKFMGAGYWYCAIAEHVSFLSPAWCERQARELGLELFQLERFSHGRAGALMRLLQATLNVVHRFAPGLLAWIRRRGIGTRDAIRHPELADYPPSWISANDHLIAMFRLQKR